MRILIIAGLLLTSCTPHVYVAEIKGPKGDTGAAGADGRDGADGQDAELPPYAIVELIDVCGAQGPHDEVLLRFANGQLLASFSDNTSGKNTRFSLLGPGSYITSDGTNCNFTVTDDYEVID